MADLSKKPRPCCARCAQWLKQTTKYFHRELRTFLVQPWLAMRVKAEAFHRQAMLAAFQQWQRQSRYGWRLLLFHEGHEWHDWQRNDDTIPNALLAKLCEHDPGLKPVQNVAFNLLQRSLYRADELPRAYATERFAQTLKRADGLVLVVVPPSPESCADSEGLVATPRAYRQLICHLQWHLHAGLRLLAFDPCRQLGEFFNATATFGVYEKIRPPCRPPCPVYELSK